MRKIIKIVIIFAVCAAVAGASPQIAKMIVHRAEDVNVTVTIICVVDVLLALVKAFLVLDQSSQPAYLSRR